MKLDNARVLLTGASGGIGQEAAQALLDAGASVLLAGRSPTRLSAQCQALQRQRNADRVRWHDADLDDASSIAGLARAAAEWQCNVVVHGAGVPSFGRLESVNPEDMQQLLRVNLLAPMLLTQALLPHLRALPHAQIVCIGSVVGALGLPGYSVYGASKAGLRGFAQALRRELADSSVKVQYLGPRSTRTAFNNGAARAYADATHTASDAPQVVAQALVEMLRRGTAERFLGFPEKLAVRINGLASTLLDGAFASHRKHLQAVPAAAPAIRAASAASTAPTHTTIP